VSNNWGEPKLVPAEHLNESWKLLFGFMGIFLVLCRGWGCYYNHTVTRMIGRTLFGMI
jgi:hypothetical protein